MNDECKDCIWNYNGICTCQGIKPCDVEEGKEDLIKRNLAIAYATSGLIRKIDGEDWIRTSEVKQSLNDVPTVEQEVYMTGEDCDLYMRGYNQARKDFERNQGEWVITVDNYPNPHYPTTSYTCPFCNSTFYWGYQYCCICGSKMANGMDYKIERGIKE